MQGWRKTFQIGVLLIFLIIFPLFNLYGNALEAYGPYNTGELYNYRYNITDAVVTENSVAWKLVIFLDWFWGLLSLPAVVLVDWLERFKGAPWTITLFGFTISDPLAVLGVWLAEKSVSIGFVVSALIPLVVVLFLGRIFCSWICPMGTLLEFTQKLRRFLEEKGIPLKDHRFSTNWKYVLLVCFLLMSVLGLQVFSYILPYVQLGRNAFYWFFYGSFSLGLILVGLIILFDLLVSKRGWCKYFCPSGALLTLLSKARVLRVTHSEELCRGGCSKCEQVCGLGISGKKSTFNSECTNCGNCVSGCPRHALNYSFIKTRKEIDIKNNNIGN